MVCYVLILTILVANCMAMANDCSESDSNKPPTRYIYEAVSMQVLDQSAYGPNTRLKLVALPSDPSESGLNWEIQNRKLVTAESLKVERLIMYKISNSCLTKVLHLEDTPYCDNPSPEVAALGTLFGFAYGGFVNCPFEAKQYSLRNYKIPTALPSVFQKGKYFIDLKFSVDDKSRLRFTATVVFS